MVGHATRDEVDGGVRLGGAASYAALAAACLGYETALVTVAPPDDPLLEPLRRAPRLISTASPSGVMTTFALEYAGGQRRLWLRRRARALALDDIPAAWRRPRVAYVGPVAGECDGAFVRGLQRAVHRRGAPGLVAARRTRRAGPARAPRGRARGQDRRGWMSRSSPRRITRTAMRWCNRASRAGGTAAITRGARGATLIRSSERL